MGKRTAKAMDRDELSKVLNTLKYHASSNSKSSAEFKSQARAALDAYQALPADSKSSFLTKFTQNRKDLSWVKSFQSSHGETNKKVDSHFEGWVNRHQLLKMNGFNPTDFAPKDLDALVQDILKLAADQFKYEPKVAEHPNPLLVQDEYKMIQGKNVKHTTFDNTTLKDDINGDAPRFFRSILQALGDGASGSSSTDPSAVKVQSPELVKIRAKQVLLKSGKTSLGKRLNEGRDISADLAIKQAKNPALGVHIVELKRALDEMETFLARLRVLVAHIDAMDEGSPTEGVFSNIEDHETTMNAHLDGSKLMYKRLRALLG